MQPILTIIHIYGINVLWKLKSSALKYYSSQVYFSKDMTSDSLYLLPMGGENTRCFTRVIGKMSKNSN